MKTLVLILVVIAIFIFILIDWHISIQIFNGYEQSQLVLDDYILILKVVVAGSAAIYFINSLEKKESASIVD